MKHMKKTAFFVLALCMMLTSTGTASAAYGSKSYLYGGTTATYISRVERTGKSLDTVCPDYFEIGSTGDLKYSKAVDPLLLASMKDKNIAVTPFFSNHWDRALARKMLAKRADAAQQLADAVTEHGLDGVDIDIQNIVETDKDDFTDFIRLLRSALPAEKVLTVCVPANPYYTSAGWQGGYDYAALNKYCDHIFIMTYDESYPGGEPGPVASYWFIENAIKYGLQYVPKEKLYIGLPLYGRYWIKGEAPGGEAFTTSDIERIVSLTSSAVRYDRDKECARAEVTVGASDDITTWGGTKLKPGTYDIWFDNARSYEKKLTLVRKYDIGGVGTWALGQEPVEFWSGYAVWLNGTRFIDIAGHWAQSYILELTERGVINGLTEKLFKPQDGLTRAQAATLLVRLAGREDVAAKSPFTDTAGHWAEKYIAAAAQEQLVSGVTATLFEPDRNVTREELAVMLARYLNMEETYDVSQPMYTDVSKTDNDWSLWAIIGLSINGVYDGYPDGTFRPKRSVTRAEAAKLLSLASDMPTRFLKSETIPLDRAHIGPR